MVIRKKPPPRERSNRGPGLRGKQMGVAFPDDLRDRLDAESTAKGISVAEEVRQRLEKSYKEDDLHASRPDLQVLSALVTFLAFLSEEATGKRWDVDAGAAKLLGMAFAWHLERHYDADDLAEVSLTDGYRHDKAGKPRTPEDMAIFIEMMAELTLRKDPDVHKYIAEFETIKSKRKKP